MTLKTGISFCDNLQLLVVTVSIITLQFSVLGQIIEFENDSYDFGQVQYNSETKRFLKFKNSGTDTLIITSFPKTACGCDRATIQHDKMKYSPNEEGILIYSFDTGNSRKYDNTVEITLMLTTPKRFKLTTLKRSILTTPKRSMLTT